MVSDVWYGVHASQEGCDFNDVNEYCLECERLGLDTFTVMDHYMNQERPYKQRKNSLDAWMLLAGLATTTNKIKLGTLVSCYAYRPPTVLAKMATTLDRMTNGRIIYGIGAGWHVPEFESYIGRYPPAGERLTGLEETAQIARNMFNDKVSSFEGKLYKVKDVYNSPPPIQEHIPILIGGGGEKRTLKIVAKYADISHIFPWGGPEEVRHKFKVLKKHCDSVGRDFDEIRKGVHFSLILGEEEERKRKYRELGEIYGFSYSEMVERVKEYGSVAVVGSVDDVCAEIKRYKDLGIGWYTFSFNTIASVDDVESLVNEIIPSISPMTKL